MVLSLLLAGTATAFNAGTILHKFRNNRKLDALIDLGVTATMSAIYAGTMGGTTIAMVASLIFSIYLWFFPVQLPEFEMTRTKNVLLNVAIGFGLLAIIALGNAYLMTIIAFLA